VAVSFTTDSSESHRVESSRAGFSIVEALVALAILGLLGLGVSSALDSLDSGTRKARVVGTMIAVESSISEALLSAASFENYKTILASPSTPFTQFTLNFMGVPLASFVGGIPAKTFFDLSGSPCSPGPLSRNCLVEVEFYIRREAPAGPVPTYQVNYRVSALDSTNSTSPPIPPLGLPQGQSLVTGQMGIRIPPEFYTPLGQPSCLATSNAGLVLRGYDSVTGAALCWTRPPALNECPAGTVPVGLEAVEAAGTEGVLKVRCQSVRRIVCDDARYALVAASGVASLVLPTAPETAGSCVYRGVSQVAPRVRNGIPYCPSDYHLQSNQCVLNTEHTAIRNAQSVQP